MFLISTRGRCLVAVVVIEWPPFSGRWCRSRPRSPGRPRGRRPARGHRPRRAPCRTASDCMTRAPRMAPGMVPIPPAREVTTDDCRGDHIELAQGAETADRGIETSDGHRSRDPDQDPHRHEGPDDGALGLDSGQDGGLGIAPNREDIATEAEPVGDEAHDQGDSDQDEHRIGDAERDLEPAFRPGDALLLGVRLEPGSRAGSSCW